jgi:hypothetical protein
LLLEAAVEAEVVLVDDPVVVVVLAVTEQRLVFLLMQAHLLQ